MAKTATKKAKTATADRPPRKKTAERVSDREDGRLPTVIYVKPELLLEVQAEAKSLTQPTWLFIEGVLERAMKSRRAK
jgi:hypothetical protein